jgi:hypothetical protein
MTMANLNGQVNGSFHQGSTTPNPPLLAAHPSINNGSTMEAYAPEIEDPSTLDHALLESLFYNEMMMFNTSSPSASNFLSHHFNEATATHPTTSNAPVVASDPNTIAEKEMLRAFGVSESPLLHDPPSSRTSTNTSTNDSTTMEAWIAPAVATKTVRNAVAKFPPQSTHISIYPVPVPPATAAPLHPPPPARVAPVVASKPAAKDDAEAAAAAADVKPKPALSIDPPTPVSHERAKQLVDQFATLASRLGITLPPTVLQSLTTAASKNDPQTPGTATTTTTTEPTPPVQSSASPIQAEPQSPVEEERILAGPIVAELRRTAEEAIAAVSKKRPAADPEATDGTTTANENNSPGSNKPLYSKRRKKPRLSDCESRLAELKAENETLKRHLQNKYHKAHRFDQEKEEAGRRIQRLWESDAGPQEMDQAVQEFSDMYSDYGVNRQHELSFHLEQLQRYAIPERHFLPLISSSSRKGNRAHIIIHVFSCADW